jgi:cytochrome c oxidase subunit 2
MNKLLKTFVFFILVFVLSQALLVQNALSSTSTTNKRGKALFALCIQCHGKHGGGNHKIKAPAIAGMELWYIERQLNNYKSGVRGLHPEDIPSLRMRPMARTLRYKDDVKNVAEYVSSLPRPKVKNMISGNIENGKTSYANCMACHGANGEGIQAMNAPSLSGLSDWYLVSQLRNFKSKIRGADPAKDPFGAMMVSMAMTLADDQAIHDVVSYIKTLKK